MMTHQEARKLWIEALRSDEYEQGHGSLHTKADSVHDTYNDGKDHYCCLGVLCDVAEQHGVPIYRDEDGEIKGGTLTAQSDDVLNWVRLCGHAGDFGNDSLAGINDDGRTFVQIADTIEAEPEGMFCD